MKHGWFQHNNLTTEEADELEHRYAAAHVKTQRALGNDFIHWTLSAWLPEGKHAPRPDTRYQQRFWG